MTPQISSMRRRLNRGISLAIFAFFLLGSVVTFLFVRRGMIGQLDHHLEITTRDFIAESERNDDGEFESEFHELELEHFEEASREAAAYYQVFDRDGNSILKSDSLKVDESLPFERVEGDELVFRSIKLPAGIGGRITHSGFQPDVEEWDMDDPGDVAEFQALTAEQRQFLDNFDRDSPENRLYLSVAEDANDVRRALRSLIFTLILTGVILALVSAGTVAKIISRETQAIVRLSRETEAMDVTNLQSLLPVEKVPEEIRPLVEKFNEFVLRVRDTIQREKRFSIDIAHELRTPISEIRTLLEVGPDPEDDPSEIFETGVKIATRMSRIVEALTAIHQSENVAAIENPIEQETVVSSIIREAIEALLEEKQNRVQIDSAETESSSIMTDPSLLRAVVGNLLENALIHSVPDSVVDVEWGDTRIRISNETTNLQEEDLSRLDEPFWQQDSARSRRDHFGLGLTLTKNYVRLLGGTLSYRLEGQTFITEVSFK